MTPANDQGAADAEPGPGGRSETTTIKVRWGEVDAAGRVFYPNYFAWFGEATLALFRGRGRSFGSMFRSGLGVPVIESAIRFEQPAFYDDELTLRAAVAEVRRSTFRVEHVVMRGDQLIASGHEVRAIANVGSKRSGQVHRIALSAELRDWLRGDLDNGRADPGSQRAEDER